MKTVIHYKAGSYLSVTETWIYGQIKNLKRYQPIVYAVNTKNLDIYPTEKIRSLELKGGARDVKAFFNKGWNKVFNFYPFFLFFLIKDKPDLVHAHYGPSGYNFLRFKTMFKFPLITSFYGYDLSMLPYKSDKWKLRYKKLFQQGDRFLIEGHHMRKYLIELGCPEEKVVLQHLGIDLDQIKFATRRPRQDRTIRVLIAGSFREKKGIPCAVEAFGKIREKYKNLRLTIIGDSTGAPREEREKKKILGTINKYHLGDCVRMLGYQPHSLFIKELYKHHIFLSPSVHASDGDTEGGVPVSIIEAFASGMPVLSTYHCDIPEVVMDGESGYLVPERDVNALTEKLEFLVSNPEVWEKMGKIGREHIEKNYNLITQVRKLEDIYDSLLRN